MIRTVVHFIDSSAVGGTEHVALQMMTGLDRQQWRPVLLHHNEPGLAKFVDLVASHHIDHHVVPRMETAHDLLQLPAFRRTIRAENPSVFHAHLSWPLSCKYGLLAAKVARVPAVVASAHTRLEIRESLRRQPKLIAPLVDRYLPVSNAVAMQLRDEFGIPAGKLEVVHNGIDTARWTSTRDTSLRMQLLGNYSGPLVMTVARLDQGKGHRDLFEAARALPDAVFVLVGDGPNRASLEAAARELGVSDRIRLLGARQDVPSLLACADLFALPSLSEGLSVCLLEAMAAGVPIVATNIGGNDEVLEDGRTGLLVPPASPAPLAEAIRRLSGDPDLAGRLVFAARTTVESRFTSRRMVQRVTAVYDELLAP
jgi:L-malate glycosyltransferase